MIRYLNIRHQWIIVWALMLSCLQTTAVRAQSVESKISSMEMLVGEQVELTVTAHAKDTARVEFPTSLLMPTGIEVLEAVEEPAVSEGNGMVRRQCNYVLTSFADTLYPLPPVPVRISGKEYTTRQLALKVFTVDVDTTNYEKYYGPKDVQNLPMSWTDDQWGRVMWLSLLLVALILIGLYMFARVKSNKPIIAHIKIIKRVPPHQKAMKAIDEIKSEHMATAEDSKAYYTRLTETLRQYINERYGFNAMEMTSSEIIERLISENNEEALDELREIFRTADLVKFAKWSTLINENDANLVAAVEYVNQTKIEPDPNAKPEPEIIKETDQKRLTQVKIMRVAMIVLGVLSVVLLAWIIWRSADLLM